MELDHRLITIFRRIFADPSLSLTPQTTAKDVNGWDSLKNIELIVALEKEFKVRLPTKTILNAENVGDLALALGALK